MDMAEILKEVVNQEASDLHLAVGVPPVVRIDGHLQNLDYPAARRQRGSRAHLQHPLAGSAPEAGDRLGGRLLLLALWPGTLPRQRLLPARDCWEAAFRLVPVDIKTVEELGSAQGPSLLLSQAPRLRSGHGPTGSGKSTTLAAIIDEINPARVRSHRHHRGPHRVPAQPQALRGEPEGGGDRHQGLPDRPPLCAAAGPRRHPHRRDARPGDHPDRLDRRRDRAPGVRHAAHAGLPADHRPHDRRLPAAPAGADPGADSGHAGGHRDPATATQGVAARAGWPPARC